MISSDQAMKTLQYLAAPGLSFILNKQQICRQSVTCKGSIDNAGKYKPNLAHNKLVNVAETLIKNKDIEKGQDHFDWKPAAKLDDQQDNIADVFNGRLIQGGLVFQQNFLIRSYELGPDCKISIGALINLLQESSLNHFKSAGLVAEGFGSTLEMSRRDLIWVVYRMKIVADSYPSWADIVQIDTWACAWGRIGTRRDWLVRDYNTGKTLFRAVSVYVMMNKKTRKLSKFIEETREETKAILMDCDPIIEEDDTELRELSFATADYVRSGLSPQWSDLDVNQHVNHVKYIDWILEGVPESVVESHKLSSMSLEFRKECGKNSSLQSLSANNLVTEISKNALELDHTIRLQNGSEVLRGRTMWTPRK